LRAPPPDEVGEDDQTTLRSLTTVSTSKTCSSSMMTAETPLELSADCALIALMTRPFVVPMKMTSYGLPSVVLT
jgi:hypothetical protein